MEIKKQKLKKYQIGIIAVMLALIILIGALLLNHGEKPQIAKNAELARAMTYNRVQEGEEKVQITNQEGQKENFDFVEFDAFFLRDLDGDGYADGVRGTCKELGKEDTMYMELNVLTNGYLKNGKITINKENFYF